MISASPRRVLCLAVVCLTAACGTPVGGNDAGCITDCELAVTDAGTAMPRPVTDPVDTSNHSLEDGGRVDAGVINAFPALTDYYRCNTDTDCPIGLGECVKSVPFNRADGVRTSVTIASLDSRISAGQGVCTRVCTTDATACDTLALRDANGDQRTFTCQVISVGAAPYPSPAPAFPFANQLSLTDLAAGQPFGAICRPPFELHNDIADDFCAACDSTQNCSGLCFDFLTGAARESDAGPGTCLSLSSDGGCPFGFATRTLDAGTTFCAPLQDSASCGGCIDRDDDFFGTGHCLRNSYDCDDRNGNAYFSSSSPAHPFPSFCGQFDYNCNGLSDDSEQVGNATYLANHCEFCGDDKHGQTVNAGTPSQAVLACVNGVMQTQSCATPGRVHCSGDVRFTGCEASAVDGGAIWYADDDGDGYGDPTQTSLSCPGGSAPTGYVAVGGDCNDSESAIHPNQPDTCDCWGTCATAGARVDNDCDGQTDEDVIAYKWYSDADNDGAPGAVSNGGATFCGSPGTGLVPQLASTVVTPDCNDTDSTSYNAASRVADSASALMALPLSVSPPRNAAGNLYFVARAAGTEVCDLKDNDCNSAIDNGVQTTFYRDADNDGWGLTGTTAVACTAPAGFVATNGDCNDTVASIHPTATEVCDGIDQDCAGGVDNGVVLNLPCTTALPGICNAGRTTACTGGTLTCTSLRTAQTFDDPSTASDGGVDEDCDGPESVVYVDPTGNDSNSGLVPNLPVQTIERGLSLAVTNNRSQVWLVNSSYAVASFVNVRNRVDIVGGFARVGNAYNYVGGATQIIQDGSVNSSQRAVAVSAANLTGPTTLAHLTIQVRDPVVNGTSAVGVMASLAGTLQLRDVQINVAAGIAGAGVGSGGSGFDGQYPLFSSFMTSAGGLQTCSGQNVNGGTGTAGSGGPGSGDFGGGTAPMGAQGYDGATNVSPIAGGTQPGSLVAFPWDLASPGSGSGGFNGSGGSASGSNFIFSVTVAGAGGGSGGCGGAAGAGGRHGGSSIGILSNDTTLVLGSTLPEDKVNITVGSGGAGSAGGPGGNGGAGGNAATNPAGSRGGYGSGGRPGSGGAGGYGGWSAGIFVRASVPAFNFCTAGLNVTSRVDYSTPGTAGSAGSGGSSGNPGVHGSSSGGLPGANAGAPGLAGRIGFCTTNP